MAPTDGEAGIRDAELVASLRTGDAAAHERFVRAHIGPMRAALLRLLRDPAEADDAVQEAFLRAFRALPEFRGESRLSTWLHRVAINAGLARLRRRKAQEAHDRLELDHLLPDYVDGVPRGSAPPNWPDAAEALAQREETRAMVRRMIDRLPDNHRTVLLLRDIEELSTQETAALLGVSEGVIKTRLHRARMALRRLITVELAAGDSGGAS